jgi:glucosamine--fructose-6-phosphate aminotransferase (isomerizing)
LSKYLDHRTRKIDFTITSGSDTGYGYSVKLTADEINRIKRIQIIACGTAYHAGMVGKYFLEDLIGVPTEVQIASEMRNRPIIADEDTLTIFVSQSGETLDTLAVLNEAKRTKSLILGITNRPDSHLAQICDNLIVTECGIEVSVAATKTFVAQLASFYLLAIYLAEKRKSISAERANDLKKALLLTPALQDKILSGEQEYKNSL